jgi:hypothetical protein
MTRERLSRLQRCILAWLVAEDQRTRGHHGRQPQGPGAGVGGAWVRQGQRLHLAQGPGGEVTSDDHPDAWRAGRSGRPDHRGQNRIAALTASCE